MGGTQLFGVRPMAEDDGVLSQEEIDALLAAMAQQQAQQTQNEESGQVPQADEGVQESSPVSGMGTYALQLPERIRNIEVTLSVVLGSTTLTVGEALLLQPGAVLKLDRRFGEPFTIAVEGVPFASGHVVALDVPSAGGGFGDRLGVRITEMHLGNRRGNEEPGAAGG
jgi:flagellar motor switch protein FliN/FliY